MLDANDDVTKDCPIHITLTGLSWINIMLLLLLLLYRFGWMKEMTVHANWKTFELLLALN